MTAPEFPSYAISYSKTARALCDQLPPELRVRLADIENDLTDDPTKYQSRLIPLVEDVFVYRHPDPALEITYKIDHGRKIIYVLHLVAPTLGVRKTLFISYSHNDLQWLMELKKWLQPLEQQDIVSIWDDERIRAGADWRGEIKKALAAAKAAVLLISIDFLNSEFIRSNELPELLNAAKDRGLQVLWIAVRPSAVDETEIARYQAVHKDPPLSQLDASQREAQFLRIYKRIKEAIEN